MISKSAYARTRQVGRFFSGGLHADGTNRLAFWRDCMRWADDVQFDFGVLCTERRLIQAGAEAAAAVTGRCGFGAGQNAGRSAGYPADLPAFCPAPKPQRPVTAAAASAPACISRRSVHKTPKSNCTSSAHLIQSRQKANRFVPSACKPPEKNRPTCLVRA